MARHKRGMRVWECGTCGYWSERQHNVKRHHKTTHPGIPVFILSAYAIMTGEPSYRIVSSRTPQVAHDSYADAVEASPMVKSTPSKTSRKISLADYTWQAFEPYSSMVDKAHKLYSEIQKTKAKINEIVGPVDITPSFTPINYKLVGLRGEICEKCFTPFLKLVVKTETGMIFEVPPTDHKCRSESQVRTEQEKNIAREGAGILLANDLFTAIKELLKGNVIGLKAEKLDNVPPNSPLKVRYTPKPGDFISQVLAKGKILITLEELAEYLVDVKGTIAVYEIAERQGECYSISIDLDIREVETVVHGQDENQKNDNNTTKTAYTAIEVDDGKSKEAATTTSSPLPSQQQDLPRLSLPRVKETSSDNVSSHYMDPRLSKDMHNLNLAETYPDLERIKEDDTKEPNYDTPERIIRTVQPLFPGGEIILAATKVQSEGSGERTRIYEEKDPEHHISRAIRQRVTTINNNELRDFITDNGSTQGLYEVATTKEKYLVRVIDGSKIGSANSADGENSR